MLERIQPALIITRRELRDQFRDWRIIVPIAVLTLIFPFLANFTTRRILGFVQQYGANLIAERFIPFLLMIVGFFPISISLVIALESFAGESERRSIEPLLSSPLTDGQLYLGKLLACVITPLVAAYLGMAVYMAGVYRASAWRPDTMFVVLIILLTAVQALVMVCGAVVISTQTTSVRAANLLASFIIIPVALLIQVESVMMLWADYRVLWWVVLALLVLAVLLVRMGITQCPFGWGMVPARDPADHATPAHPDRLDGSLAGGDHLFRGTRVQENGFACRYIGVRAAKQHRWTNTGPAEPAGVF
jgi:ABC-type transport system involved in multi-copper enzyme maturation permease subunit